MVKGLLTTVFYEDVHKHQQGSRLIDFAHKDHDSRYKIHSKQEAKKNFSEKGFKDGLSYSTHVAFEHCVLRVVVA